MSDAKLEQTFVPDVYQRNIHLIDYHRMWNRGIRLLTFDIDDTLNDVLLDNVRARLPFCKVTMPRRTRMLFRDLKSMGFVVVLLTNAMEKIAEDSFEDLGADDWIAKANKPDPASFILLLKKYCENDNTRMAHIGNSLYIDVAGGNGAGVTTCLVRRAGISQKIEKGILQTVGISTSDHIIRIVLESRGLWRKYHKHFIGDQYYQLGESQR